MNKQILFVITAVLLSAAFARVALHAVNAAKAQLPSTPPLPTPSPGGNATNMTYAAGANMSK
jgi:hypothetical protein